ncbi:signal peptidase I [Nocardioides nanhaiensis]|uniref:Signal peptidase I n=1 Tax=Nocardioides nanhaiensis TaxID=1476871 RepID=A0ABP8VR44_9ACTN
MTTLHRAPDPAPPTTAPASGRWGAGRFVVRVVAWVVVLGVTGVLLAAVLLPRVAGATPFAVLTGSMQPGLPPGSLVVVRPVEPEELGVGDVITYQLRSGAPAVVTHRVVGVGYDGRGELSLQTQGDANDAPDPLPVRPVQVRGELWYSLPHVGRLHVWLTGSQRDQLAHVAAGLLLLYAARAFFTALRERRRRLAGSETAS